MNETNHQPSHEGGRGAEHPPHGPRWRRMHHSPFFWLALCFISAAMIVYIVTNDLSFWPGHQARQPVPALTP